MVGDSTRSRLDQDRFTLAVTCPSAIVFKLTGPKSGEEEPSKHLKLPPLKEKQASAS